MQPRIQSAPPGMLEPGNDSREAEMPNWQAKPESPWKTKAELAAYYHCDIRTITNWMKRRILPFVKIRRLVRFNVVDCDRATLKYTRNKLVE